MKNLEEDKFNFQYIVEYDYDRTPCTCRPGKYDYCRCTKIINTEIKNIDIEEIKKNLPMLKDAKGKPLKLYPLDNYCIDRLLRIYKIYDKSLWEIEVDPGYYGQEIGGVYFKNQIDLFSDIEQVLRMQKNEDKMELVLVREYGYLLDVLEDKIWGISTISKKSLVQKQETYHKKVEKCDFYKDWKLPICVVLEVEEGKYRLIDGYHRLSMCETDEMTVVVARSK